MEVKMTKNIQQPDVLMVLKTTQIRRFVGQVREEEDFTEKDLQELGMSIQEIGQDQPITVRRLEEPDGDFLYELVNGERRLRASLLREIPHITAVVTHIKDEFDQYKRSVIANFHSKPNSHFSRYTMVMRLLSEGCNVRDIRYLTGKSDAWVYQYSSLQKLPEKLRTQLLKGSEKRGELGFRAAVILARVKDMERMKQIYVAVLKLPPNLRMNKLQALVESDSPPVSRQKRPRNLTDFRRILTSFADATATKAGNVAKVSDEKMVEILASMSGVERSIFLSQLRECHQQITAIMNRVQNFKVEVTA
jgi:ParB/RepB/Spo0J family partition protein